MTSHARARAERITADLRAVTADRLQCVIVYGAHAGSGAPAELPVHVLAVVRGLAVADLEALARHAAGWRRAGLATPLLLDETEFARSLDAFPIEFGSILAHHDRVWGDDPFTGARVDPRDLRRACEVQVRSHVLHLREGFLETGGRPDAIAALVSSSAAPLHTLLTNLATLASSPSADPHVLASLAGAWTGTPSSVFGDVLSLARPADGVADAARLYPAYLAGMEQLAQYVDRSGVDA